MGAGTKMSGSAEVYVQERDIPSPFFVNLRNVTVADARAGGQSGRQAARESERERERERERKRERERERERVCVCV